MKTELIEKRDQNAPPRVTTFIVHAQGETRVVQASEHDTMESIVEQARFDLHSEHVNIFLGESVSSLRDPDGVDDGEDDHEPAERHHKPSEHGHGGGIVHIHCHKCRRVKTDVAYNGVEKHHKFSPAATIETVRRWAVAKFKIPAIDAEKLFVWVPGAEQPLDGTKHVGDLAQAPGCKAEFMLLPDPRVNG
jgi:hypothetical protein